MEFTALFWKEWGIDLLIVQVSRQHGKSEASFRQNLEGVPRGRKNQVGVDMKVSVNKGPRVKTDKLRGGYTAALRTQRPK